MDSLSEILSGEEKNKKKINFEGFLKCFGAKNSTVQIQIPATFETLKIRTQKLYISFNFSK
jgi:hypothetical protein